jgi:hypothetical protein
MTTDDGKRDSGTLLQVKLNGGRGIWCWQYLASYTYAHFQIRSSSEECNQEMLRVVRSEAKRVFGDWPVHVLEPARPDGVVDYPKVRFIGFFTSLPMTEPMHLSSLVIVWFQGAQWPAMSDETFAAVKAVDWERLARDYET